jgi:hypothetical protein
MPDEDPNTDEVVVPGHIGVRKNIRCPECGQVSQLRIISIIDPDK